MNAKMSLEELIAAEFKGPIALRAVKARRDTYPQAVRLESVEATDVQTIYFPVAAFRPQLGVIYHCYTRVRNNITECIPEKWRLSGFDQWSPLPRPNDQPIIFKRDDRDRFSARDQMTGQMILPRKEWVLPVPDSKGEIIIPVGQIEIRPTATRTFWIAGEIGSLAHLNEFQLVTYDNDQPIDYSFAAQFQLFSCLYSAFEVLGNPFRGFTIEIDRKNGSGLEFNLAQIGHEIDQATSEFERWMARELLPLLHPDSLDQHIRSEKTREEILAVVETTRYESLRLIEWYKGWAANLMADFRRRLVVGIVPKLEIPKIVGNRRLRPGRLVDLKRADLEKILFEPPKAESKKKSIPTKVEAEPIEPVTPTAAAVKTRRKPVIKEKPLPESITTIGELIDVKKNGKTKQKLEDLAKAEL